MSATLKALASFVSVLSFVADLVSRWLKARDVKAAAEAINKEEAQNARDAAAILAERRGRDDLLKRLRDGSF